MHPIRCCLDCAIRKISQYRPLSKSIIALLTIQIVQKPSQDKKVKLTPQSKIVADQVAKLVKSAEALKGKSFRYAKGVGSGFLEIAERTALLYVSTAFLVAREFSCCQRYPHL